MFEHGFSKCRHERCCSAGPDVVQTVGAFFDNVKLRHIDKFVRLSALIGSQGGYNTLPLAENANMADFGNGVEFRSVHNINTSPCELGLVSFLATRLGSLNIVSVIQVSPYYSDIGESL